MDFCSGSVSSPKASSTRITCFIFPGGAMSGIAWDAPGSWVTLPLCGGTGRGSGPPPQRDLDVLGPSAWLCTHRGPSPTQPWGSPQVDKLWEEKVGVAGGGGSCSGIMAGGGVPAPSLPSAAAFLPGTPLNLVAGGPLSSQGRAGCYGWGARGA